MHNLLCQLQRHWRIVVIVATIFSTGWLVREGLTAEIKTQVTAAERRINAEMEDLKEDVRGIYAVLLRRESRALDEQRRRNEQAP